MSNPYPPQKRFTRSSNNKILAGVCGGAAEYLNMDVTLVRVLWVVLTLVTGGGIGVILYIVLALALPENTTPGGYPPVNGPQAPGQGYAPYQPPQQQAADPVWGNTGAPWEQQPQQQPGFPQSGPGMPPPSQPFPPSSFPEPGPFPEPTPGPAGTPSGESAPAATGSEAGPSDLTQPDAPAQPYEPTPPAEPTQSGDSAPADSAQTAPSYEPAQSDDSSSADEPTPAYDPAQPYESEPPAEPGAASAVSDSTSDDPNGTESGDSGSGDDPGRSGSTN